MSECALRQIPKPPSDEEEDTDENGEPVQPQVQMQEVNFRRVLLIMCQTWFESKNNIDGLREVRTGCRAVLLIV